VKFAGYARVCQALSATGPHSAPIVIRALTSSLRWAHRGTQRLRLSTRRQRSSAGILARPYLSVKDPYTASRAIRDISVKSSGALVQDVRAKSTATIEVPRTIVDTHAVGIGANIHRYTS